MNANVTNSPYATTEHWVGGTLVVYGSSSNNVSGSPVIQVLYYFDNTTYVRIYWDGTWSTWQGVTTQSYLNQYTSLSSLASALGVVPTQVYNTGANLFFSYVGCAYVLGVTDDYSQFGIWLAIATGTGGSDKTIGVQQLAASPGVEVATNFMGTFAPNFSGSFKLYVTFMLIGGNCD